MQGTDSKPEALNINSVVTVLEPDLGATPVAISPTLYEDLHRDFENFHGRWLLQSYRFDTPWPNWEKHPAGDEIVYLLEGDVDMVLYIDDEESIVRVSEPGSYIIVPRNTWHTARPHAPTRMLFITPGEGTEHHDKPA